jgi:hypothetical protein
MWRDHGGQLVELPHSALEDGLPGRRVLEDGDDAAVDVEDLAVTFHASSLAR